jgi:hypothetical protein
VAEREAAMARRTCQCALQCCRKINFYASVDGKPEGTITVTIEQSSPEQTTETPIP